MKMTGYDRWLLETAEAYPVTVLSGYADAQGVFTPWSEDNWPIRLKEMNYWRYNRLYDSAGRLPENGMIRREE